MKRILSVLFLVTLASSAAILDDSRMGYWGRTNVGVLGGIPVVTDIYTNIWYTGPGDYTTIFKTAYANCTSNRVIKVWPGRYEIGQTIDFQSYGNGMVTRGVGPARTVIAFTNSGAACFYLRHGAFSENALTNFTVDLATDAVKGSNQFKVLSVPAWLVVNGHYILDCTNDTNFVYGYNSSENEHPAMGYRSTMTQARVLRDMGQIVKVTTIAGTNITCELPFNMTYPVVRTAQLAQSGYDPSALAPPSRIGFENLTIEGAYTGTDTDLVRGENLDNCWFSNVVFTNTPGARHIWSVFGYRDTFRDTDFLDSHSWASGKGYGLALYHLCSYCLIENCIFYRLHISMDMSYGSSGNVWSYNFCLAGKSDSGQNPGYGTHGTHCLRNLAEGNYIIPKVGFDWSHGSSSHQVVFRNRVVGHQSDQIYDQTPVNDNFYNRTNSFVGNIFGDVGWHTNYEAIAGTDVTCGAEARNIFKLGYFLGFACDNSPDFDDVNECAAIRAVNFDVVTSTNHGIFLGGFTTNDVPNSLIDGSAPFWWPPGKHWPPFDPNMGASASFTNLLSGMRWQVKTNFQTQMVVKVTASTLKLGF